MKTALVYDWFVGMGGGEKVVELIHQIFPSPIYTLLCTPNALKGTGLENEIVNSSFIKKLPWAFKKYRSYLPLFPLAIEQFDLSQYDLVISCSHCVAKGVLTHADQIHLNYCYTPVRYAWDLYQQYLNEDAVKGRIKGALARCFLHYLRLWDVHASQRVDSYAAISKYVARRIKKTYGKDAEVIYPAVDTQFFVPGSKKESYYLAASRLVGYKKIDIVVSAFAKMPDKKLVVIGDGPDLQKIKGKAAQNIEILGYQSNEVLRKHYQEAKAFIFAAVEDFGSMPVEAQACGIPVIALGKGGALETVIENRTGIFFHEQTVEAVQEAVQRFDLVQDAFDPGIIRAHAESFAAKRFFDAFRSWVQREYNIDVTSRRKN